MRHSRALALLTDNYADRTQNLQFAAVVAAGFGPAPVLTYTVGANIQARLENLYLLVAPGGGGGGVFILVTARGFAIDTMYQPAAATLVTRICDTIIPSGQQIQFTVQNGGGVGVFIQGVAHVREIDL